MIADYLNVELPEREVAYFIEKLSEESMLLNGNVKYLSV